ncbi:MAG: ABC transporter ATP-binding protein [Hymenobacter sp.]
MPVLSPPVIRATCLRKAYGAHAVVHDVSFEVGAGETLVLLGPSGCGKTTLLKMLNRLVKPDAGTVEINGRDVLAQPAEVLRRGIGYVIQQVGLLPHYTVAENVAVVPRLLGHAPAAIAARTTALLTRLHLPPARYAGQLPHQLSGGQQQRVGLARALAADPPIVLLDEPFGALDPLTRARIRREFRELEELRSKTVVLVTHDVTEAFELADRILLLDAGRVQQLGTPRELLFRPANDFVRRFFAAERLALQLRTLTLGDVFPGEAETEAGEHAHPAMEESAGAAATSASRFTPRTTVHEALEILTGTAPTPNESEDFAGSSDPDEGRRARPDSIPPPLTGPARPPFTLARLMAAFGEALQREEDAWKR